MQVFAAEDPEMTTDEDEAEAMEAQQGAAAGASEAERRAVLERLQGQDNHLAAGFKVAPPSLAPSIMAQLALAPSDCLIASMH